ncbi:MAG TPA: sialidase family protein, partial [Chitinophagaceae bacterium]
MRTKFFLAVLMLTGLYVVGLVMSGCRHVKDSGDEGEKLEMDNTAKAVHQEFLMTRDPALNMVPTQRLITAANLMRTARSFQTSNLAWTERGPNNIGGRSRAILVDKRDATGSTVFAASVSGGLFKTTNFNSPSATWTPVNDFLPNLAITCLVQDNSNQNIMYAGTGEGWFNVDAVRGAGIFKSTDGGTTWSVLPSTIKTTPADSTFEYVQDLAIDNNGNIYASLRNLTGFSRGVKRSADGGTTWTQVLGIPLTDLPYTTGRGADLEVASNGDVYATLGIFTPTMVLKSSFAIHGANTGAAGTWQDITPTHSETTYRGELAIAPSNPQRLYLMLQDSADDQVHNVYRSDNGGSTWTSFTAPSSLNNGTNSQTWYDLIAAVDPSNPDIVVVGGIQLARSTNGGSTWTTISTSSSVHVDQHALVYFNSSRLLIGNDGGIYYSSNMTNATPTFTEKNNGFDATQFYGCDFHPTNANYFLAGAQDNNTQQFNAAGLGATNPVVGGDGGIPHIHQTDGQLQIASTTNNNYYRSEDGGSSFASLG